MLIMPLVLVLPGCGSDKESVSTAPLKPLPDARTPAEWAQRIVKRFLTPMNRDFEILNNLDNPTIRFYLATGEQATVETINRSMNDLKRCTDKLVVIGPPPEDDVEFEEVDRHFRDACKSYEEVADHVLEAVPLLTSGRTDVIERGQKILREAYAPSRRAAQLFKKAIKVAQRRREFRAAGLQPIS
jgi:hypothetical protein